MKLFKTNVATESYAHMKEENGIWWPSSRYSSQKGSSDKQRWFEAQTIFISVNKYVSGFLLGMDESYQ